MSRRAVLGLSFAASAAVVAWLYAPELRCPTTCFVDPVAVRGPGLGHIEQPDLYLNAWILAWVQHALLTDPLALFDANVFHPSPASLTQSEHMLAVALWLLPLRLLSSDAVWLHQAALVGSSLLLALTTGVLVRWLSGSAWAGFAAGAAAVFMPWRFTELSHVQLMNAQWFPLVWWAMGRVLETPGRARDTAWLAAALALQLLSSFYLAYFLLLSCAGLLLGAWLVRGIPRSAWRQLALAAAAPFAAFLAMALPYLRWSRAQGFQAVDPLFDSVPPSDVLALTLPDPTAWLRGLPVATSYAVPLVVAGLAVVALLPARLASGGATPRHALRQRPFALGLALACLGALVLALGRQLAWGDWHLPLPGSLAAALVPGFENLRNPLRFAIVIGVAAPVLAGVGFARLEALGATAPARAALRAALLLLLALNLATPPLPARDAWEGAPERVALYRALRDLPPGPLLEIPWPLQQEHDAIHAGRAMLGSTLHWLPLLNGHSGYVPRIYPFLRRVGQALPSAEGVARLEALVAVRYLLVDGEALPPERRAAWRDLPAGGPLRPVIAAGPLTLYEVEGWEEAGVHREAVAGIAARETTLAGHSRAPLSPADQRGALRVEVDGPFHFAGRRRLPRPVTLLLHNAGARTWPGLDPDPEGLVRLRARFLDARGEVAAEDLPPLVADVPPGDTALRVAVAPPARAGRYRLRVDLVQRVDGVDRPLAVPPVEVPVEVRAAL